MTMPDPYGAFYAAFLKDHPEELAGIRTVMVDGESTLLLSVSTLQRFITWALGMGLVRNVDWALGVLADLPHLEARAREAHPGQEAAALDNLLLRERPQTKRDTEDKGRYRLSDNPHV